MLFNFDKICLDRSVYWVGKLIFPKSKLELNLLLSKFVLVTGFENRRRRSCWVWNRDPVGVVVV